ncbi:MAG: MaoC family dehydratase [Parvibaculales bacterium]
MTLVIEKTSDLPSYVGKELGKSEWFAVEQDRINLFADATEDHQFIHIDEEAAKLTPFGTTIAHGFLTLSLVPRLVQDIYRVADVKMGVNYGLNRVRFLNPVKVGSRVQASAVIKEVGEAAGGTQVILEVTIAIEGEEKPACVAEFISLVYA